MSAKAIKEIIDAGADKVVEFMNKGRDNAADIVVAAYADPEQGVRFYDDSTIGSKTTKLIYENYYNLNETAQDFVKHSELFEGEAIEDLQDLKTPEEKDEFFRTASNVIDTHYYCSGSEQNIWDYFVYWPNRAKLRVVLNIQSTLNSVLKLAAYKNIFNKEPARDRARKFLLWAIRENKADQNMLDSIKVYDLFPEILALKELQTNEEKIEFFKDPDNLAATREFCLANDTTVADYIPFWPKECILNELNSDRDLLAALITVAYITSDPPAKEKAKLITSILEDLYNDAALSSTCKDFIRDSSIFPHTIEPYPWDGLNSQQLFDFLVDNNNWEDTKQFFNFYPDKIVNYCMLFDEDMRIRLTNNNKEVCLALIEEAQSGREDIAAQISSMYKSGRLTRYKKEIIEQSKILIKD